MSECRSKRTKFKPTLGSLPAAGNECSSGLGSVRRKLRPGGACSIGAGDQHRDFEPVTHAIHRLTQQQVANHAMPVRAHNQRSTGS